MRATRADAGRVRHALERLQRLDGAPAARVRDFVQAFGPLFAHDVNDLPPLHPFRRINRDTELVPWYHEVAALLTASARVAGCVRRAQRLYVRDLEIIDRFLALNATFTEPSVRRASRECLRLRRPAVGDRTPYDAGARSVVEGVVNWWLLAGAVRPFLRWREAGRPEIACTGWLWGAIGMQLLADVQRGGKTAPCDWCGREVRRERRPKRGQRVCCTAVGCRRDRDLDAQRRRRQGQRAGA